MGRQDLTTGHTDEELRAFMKAILADVHGLERMLQEERFETGVRRIGAEQEMFLVTRACRPAPIAMDVLEKLDSPSFTTELARFNLEANLTPRRFRFQRWVRSC